MVLIQYLEAYQFFEGIGAGKQKEESILTCMSSALDPPLGALSKNLKSNNMDFLSFRFSKAPLRIH